MTEGCGVRGWTTEGCGVRGGRTEGCGVRDWTMEGCDVRGWMGKRSLTSFGGWTAKSVTLTAAICRHVSSLLSSRPEKERHCLLAAHHREEGSIQ